ncbi:MAG: hypothetical protein KDM91_09505 [Verrucomicrobiae bacterium]|nr:hypothetical protein [Verrucomicrobiae bacterium]
MKAEELIESFVRAVRVRLNRFRWFDAIVWALAVAGAILLLACLVQVMRGHAVPRLWYGIGGGIAALLMVIHAIVRRVSPEAAAHFADRFFELKDTVVSWRHFRMEGRSGEIFDLQEAATAAKVGDLRPATIRYRRPVRLMAVAGLAIALSAVLAFKKASPDVLEKLRVAEETTAKTEEINEHLEEAIDELEKGASEEEKEILEPEKLRELVEELKKTEDRKEALRQYAELERKLQEAAQRLDQRKNEQLLAKAGEELQKDLESKELGKKLEEKEYRKAAEELEQFKPANPEKKLSEQRKELAKLKAAAQRMTSAAQAASRQGASSQKSGQQNKGTQSQADAGASQSGSGSASGQNGEGGGSSGSGEGLEDQIAQLDRSVRNLEKALKNAEIEKLEKSDSECKNCRGAVLSDLDKLKLSLCKIGAKKDCQSLLLSMCQKMGQCQSYLSNSQCQSLSQCLSASPGGKKAGKGSVESRREGREDTGNGQLAQLQGQKNEGQSFSTVEAADSGDGVSTRRGGGKEREFRRQLESFVQREDVPEDVKEGVKAYFKNIHGLSEPATPAP